MPDPNAIAAWIFWIDLLVAAILVLSTLAGAWSGLFRILLALALDLGWLVLSFLLSSPLGDLFHRWFLQAHGSTTPETLGSHLLKQWPDLGRLAANAGNEAAVSSLLGKTAFELTHAGAVVLAFILLILLGAILCPLLLFLIDKTVKQFLPKSFSAWIDRPLGALFGLLRGGVCVVLILVPLLFFLSFDPPPGQPRPIQAELDKTLVLRHAIPFVKALPDFYGSLRSGAAADRTAAELTGGRALLSLGTAANAASFGADELDQAAGWMREIAASPMATDLFFKLRPALVETLAGRQPGLEKAWIEAIATAKAEGREQELLLQDAQLLELPGQAWRSYRRGLLAGHPVPGELGPLTALNSPSFASLLVLQALKNRPPARFVHATPQERDAAKEFLGSAITPPPLRSALGASMTCTAAPGDHRP